MNESNYTNPKPIVFKTIEGYLYYDYADIIMCSADGNYSKVFVNDSETPFRILHNITFLDKKYCNDFFIRCHKSHIINLNYIERLILKTHQVQLKKGFLVPVSNNYWRRIKPT